MASNLINEQECAIQLGISVTTLRAWRSTKRYNLEYLKIGRCVKYRPEAIERFMASRTVSGGGDE